MSEVNKNFAKFYFEYKALVRSVLYRTCLVSHQEFEDLFQETFLKLWKKLPQFKQKSQLKTWIYRVTVNVALDFCRKQNREKEHLKEQDFLVNHMEDSKQNLIKYHEDREIVKKALSLLDPQERSLIILAWVENLSINDLAQVFEVPEGTIKSRLYHSKQKMISIFENWEIEYE